MKKILVVDDDKNLAELIAEFCRDAGLDTRFLTDSSKAVELAAEWKPDLITLDIEMPGVDGIEVLRRLQGDERTNRIPVVIISVVAKGALTEGILKGARMVFEKPLRFQKLIKQLQDLLSRPAQADAESVHFEPHLRTSAP